MKEGKRTGKALLVGIIAAVLVLAGSLVLLLTQCTGGQEAVASTAAPTTEPQTYDIYWNLDRLEYAGKSEAGMSSRVAEADGFWHIRFFVDGQEVVLKAATRKVVNAIDVNDIMGLEFDEQGLIVGVIPIDEMPVQQVAWQFYVQSTGGNVIKVNSSKNFNGMEIMLEDVDPTRIWDMTGISGPVGCVAEAIKWDRIMAIADLDGNVTHVFITDRSEYMLTHEAECVHCKETVTWSEWTKTNAMPEISGHYQLQNDITLSRQASPGEDVKLCLDLNGHRIDGKENSRTVMLNQPSIEFAIMDTSEGQAGVIAAHGETTMGMVIMVRNGAMYLYSGTIDGSDGQNTNGGAVSISKNCYVYMHGGKIIGGEVKPVLDTAKGTYGSGAGGALYVAGKFVMHDGIVENGRATSVITYKDGKPVWNRGMGGNIYVASGGEFEMNGGTIRGGRAGLRGGNIGSDGTALITINGGTISGGYVSGDGQMGGNLYASSKVICTINGGTITGGKTRGSSGNIYCSGTLNINGGRIVGGVAYDATTGELKTTATHHNIYVVNGTLKIRGGYIQGGLNVIDTSATDAKQATVYLNGAPQITDGPNGLDLSIANDRVIVNVGTLHSSAKIGINAKHGIFSKPTKAENTDKFYSNIEGAQVVYFEECLGVGRVNCLCGKQEHAPGCDGKLLFWRAHTSGESLPTTTGNYYLTKDVVAKKNYTVGPGEDMKLDFNGHNITYVIQSSVTSGMRFYRSDNASVMTLTDTTDTPGTMKAIQPAAGTPYTGSPLLKEEVDGEKIYFEPGSAEEQAEAERLWAQGDYGTLLWARGGEINILNGIFDGSNIIGSREQGGMVIYVAKSTATDAVTGEKTVYPASMNLYGGTIKCGNVASPGNIAIKDGATFHMYGGTIEGGKANAGGALYIEGKATIHGGVISGGEAVMATGAEASGGNIYVASTGVLNVEGGTITSGKASGVGGNIYAYGTLHVSGGVVEKGEAVKCGGNIGTNASSATITVDGTAIVRDGKSARGGNLGIYVRGNKGFSLGGEAQILNGEATTGGGNICVASWLGNPGELQMTGGLVSGGKAPIGGNVYVTGSISGCNAKFTATGGTIEKGDSANGANIAIGQANATATLRGVTVHNTLANTQNILVSAGTVHIEEGTQIINEAADASNVATSKDADTASAIVMTGGTISGGTNSNVRLLHSDTFTMSGGLITGGTAPNGGNLYMEGTSGAYAVATITGGTIEKGSTTNVRTGANIRLNNASSKLTVDGATIPGGIHVNASATLTLKNAPVIDKGDSGIDYSVRMGSSARLNLDEMTGGTVYVTANAGHTLAENVTADLSAYILTEVPETEVVWNESAKTMVLKAIKSTYCTCGASKDAAYECHCLEADQGELTWQAWDGTDALPTATGNYYLKNNVDLTVDTVSKPDANSVIRIDLRGKKILLENTEDLYSFSSVSGARVVITDSTDTPGSVILTGTDTASGGILKLVGSNSVALYRATLDSTGFDIGTVDGNNTYVGSGATFTLASGQLLGRSGSRVLLVNGNADLLGGTITGGVMNIRMNNAAAKVRLAGVTISNSLANATNVRVDIGELTIEEGTTIVNTAAGATNVSTTKSGTSSIVMTGGTISGGTNSNVRLLHSDTFEMTGGTISGGTAANGGNVYVEGDAGKDAILTVKGGTISGGTTTESDAGANIWLNNANAKLVVENATIPGGVHANSTATVTLKGAPVIEKVEGGCGYSLKLGADARLILTDMTGGKVYVNGDIGNVVAENVTTDMTGYILSDLAGSEVIWNETDKTLMLDAFVNTYCTCGATKRNAYACHCLEADKGDLDWQPWVGTDALPTATGNYYLKSNVDLTVDTVSKPDANSVIRIDLRGKKILLENTEDLYSFSSVSGARVVITDSSVNPGSVILTGTDTASGGILKLVGSNSVALYRATLDSSGFNNGTVDGGNTYVGSGATFTLASGQLLGHSESRLLHVNGTAELLGGTITGGAMNIRMNNAAAKVRLAGVTVSNALANVTSIRVDIGELTIEAGTTITNTAAGATNVATTNSGASAIIMTGGTISGGTNSNVRLLHSDTFTMSGGLITGGSAANGGNLYVEGTSGAIAYATITGGTIEKGSTTNTRTGANIRLNNASSRLTVDGATIPGGIHVNSSATLTLKNAPVIDKGDSGIDYSVRIGSSGKLNVTGMTGGQVYIYTDNIDKVLSEDVATDLSGYFNSDRSDYEVVYTDNSLVYQKK